MPILCAAELLCELSHEAHEQIFAIFFLES